MRPALPFVISLLAASLVVNVALFVTPYDWSNDKYPPREQGAQNAANHQQQANPIIAPTARIECDPNCSAKNSEENRHETNISRIVRKTLDDVVALWTSALVVATVTLAIIVLIQVRESSDTNRRQLRAYVGLDRLGFELTNENNPNFVLDLNTQGIIHEDFLTIKLRNYGSTPARDVSVFAYLVPVAPHTRLPDDFFRTTNRDVAPTGNIRITLARYLLHPGQMEISKHVIHPHAVRDARAGHAMLYVYGRIYYRDIYSRPWRTRFCYQWEPGTAGRNERFVAYETYNGEDQIELG